MLNGPEACTAAFVGSGQHHELARFEMPADRTIEGDSGAPVTTDRNGGTLLGMHLAAFVGDNGAAIAVAIPAWLLLYSGSYGLDRERWDFWP